MSMRWRAIVGVSAVAILGAAAAWLWFRPTLAPVTEADCDRVRTNMTEGEIEAILGWPADYRGHAVHRRSLGKNIARGGSVSDDLAPVTYESLWYADQGSLWVQIDAGGRARVVVQSVPLGFSESVCRELASRLP